MHAQLHKLDAELERRCRAIMDMLEPVLTAEQQQRVDSFRYIVTHVKDYGLWLAELRDVLEDEQVRLPALVHQELVTIGLTLEVDPTYWNGLRRG